MKSSITPAQRAQLGEQAIEITHRAVSELEHAGHTVDDAMFQTIAIRIHEMLIERLHHLEGPTQ